MRRPAALKSVLVVCGLLLLVVTTMTGAGARPDGHAGRTAARTDAARAQIEAAPAPANTFGIPSPVPPPPEGYSDYQQPYGGPLANIPANVGRSKVQVTLPPAVALAYVRTCAAIPLVGAPELQTCCPTFAADPSCPKSAVVQHATSTVDDSGPSWTRIDAPIWVSTPADSPQRSKRPFGVFPDARVQLLAFGAIPATATVHLEQPVGADGEVSPLHYSELNFKSSVNSDGSVRVADFPLPQPYAAADTFQLVERMVLTGKVTVRISNLRVDGEAVDVGPSCRTSSAADLRYNAPRGWRSDSADPDDLLGRPGEFQPLKAATDATTGTATSTIDIPRFRGCRDGARSLDPLVTALASGPNNRVQLRLADALRACAVPGDAPGAAYRCPTYPGDPFATGQQATGQRTAQTPAAARSLDRLAELMRSWPRAQRSSIIDTLPAQARRYVAARSR